MKYPVPLVPMRDATVPMRAHQRVKLYPDGLIPADLNISLQMSPVPSLYDVTLPMVWCDGITPAVGATVTWGDEAPVVVGDSGRVTFYAQPAGTYLVTVSGSPTTPGIPACPPFENEIAIP